MTTAAVSSEGLSKRYRIGALHGAYGTLRDSLSATTRRALRHEHRPHYEDIWALRDVSFDVRDGEVLGLIGRNGAGKSTLLKILTRITTPTEGRATIRGRVGSLLEVGTGFHPELTGRENVFLNGSLLGMKRREIIQKYSVTILYTAPTAIRSFMKLGRAIPEQYDLSSLRLLGSVGEPINPEAWMWYRKIIGGKVAPIVDTWWQTETGAIMISALPGVTETKPGSVQVPLPGVSVEVVDDDGAHVGNGNGGLLVVTEPWPSMLRGIWGDPERYKETYWDKFAARATTSPATARGSTRTATCGFSAGSTMS